VSLARVELTALSAASLGVYVRSRGFALAVTASGFTATFAWGALDIAEGQRLAAAWETTFARAQHDALIDITLLTTVDPAVFVHMRDFLEAHRSERARVVRRQAVIASGGLGSSIVSGYLSIFPPPYEMRLFFDRREGLEWLGQAHLHDELEAIGASPADDVLLRLREWLDGAPLEELSLGVAAKSLGVTARTLQRRLAAANTRFPQEVARAQVARAERLMSDPQRKLSDIALEVGCATPSAFSDLFRRVTGESPRRWRARQRPG
jgi:AraC-like DNA-binding protein